MIASFPRDTLMDREGLAKALDKSVDTVDRSDFPMAFLGNGSRLSVYHWGSVCDEIARRSRRLARAS